MNWPPLPLHTSQSSDNDEDDNVLKQSWVHNPLPTQVIINMEAEFMKKTRYLTPTQLNYSNIFPAQVEFKLEAKFMKKITTYLLDHLPAQLQKKRGGGIVWHEHFYFSGSLAYFSTTTVSEPLKLSSFFHEFCFLNDNNLGRETLLRKKILDRYR